MNNVKLIHENFNLIMTFNPKYSKNSLGLDPILENKCLQFTLPPNDNDYESTAQMFYGSLINSEIDNETSYQLRGKLVNIHMFTKQKCLLNKELFEGDSIYNSRVIKRDVKYINTKIIEQKEKKENINLINIIKVVIDKFYVRPYIEKGLINDGKKSIQLEYREQIIDNLKKNR